MFDLGEDIAGGRKLPPHVTSLVRDDAVETLRTAHRLARIPGAILKTLKVPCGCSRRRDECNIEMPYSPTA